MKVRTNLRKLPGSWEDNFGMLVSSLLTSAGLGYQGGVFASCQPYLNPILPWGSNPVSNPLIGSTHFPIHTDGGDMTRLEKVAIVARWKEARDNVRVCWQGNTPGKNCGKCEKCIRTQLELLALGDTELNAFEYKIMPGDVTSIQIRNNFQLSYLTETLRYVNNHKIKGWWVDEINMLARASRKKALRNKLFNRIKFLISSIK
jgi:hypothetical protein